MDRAVLDKFFDSKVEIKDTQSILCSCVGAETCTNASCAKVQKHFMVKGADALLEYFKTKPEDAFKIFAISSMKQHQIGLPGKVELEFLWEVR